MINFAMSGELDILFDRIERKFGCLDIVFTNKAISQSETGLLTKLE